MHIVKRAALAATLSFGAISFSALHTASATGVTPYNWAGFYIGANLGYSWGEADSNLTVPNATAPSPIGPQVVPGFAATNPWT